MAGYVRQSASNIITGATITAAIFNAEFNQLQAAFDGTTGHTHTGGTGDGPRLALSTSVTGVLPLANGGTNATTASAARTNLGLGTLATQNSNAATITGTSTFVGTSVSSDTLAATTTLTAGTSITSPSIFTSNVQSSGTDGITFKTANGTTAFSFGGGNSTTLVLSGMLQLDGINYSGATGVDTTLVSGTAGDNRDIAIWNSDGDIVTSGKDILRQKFIEFYALGIVPTQTITIIAEKNWRLYGIDAICGDGNGEVTIAIGGVDVTGLIDVAVTTTRGYTTATAAPVAWNKDTKLTITTANGTNWEDLFVLLDLEEVV